MTAHHYAHLKPSLLIYERLCPHVPMPSYGSVGGEWIESTIAIIDTHVASTLQGFENQDHLDAGSPLIQFFIRRRNASVAKERA